MSETILTIKDLHKTYGKDTHALKGVSVEFKKKEFVVVIGPSGAGKSTLIRCMNRMIDSSSGEIIFNGEHIEQLSGKQLRQARSKIGMIFQHYNLVERVNVIKNVLHGRLGQMRFIDSFFGRFSQEDRQKAVDLLKRVGLEEQMYKRADELSGGQMQRVGICRALIQDPYLLLADEPIASLDPESAKTVMDTLKEMCNERDLTCIVNLHQVDYALKYATRIIGIKDGCIVYDGLPTNLSQELIQEIYKGKEAQMKLASETKSNESYHLQLEGAR